METQTMQAPMAYDISLETIEFQLTMQPGTERVSKRMQTTFSTSLKRH